MTDFYSVCQDALLVQLRTLTTFFVHDWQVSDDDTVISKGADYFAIARPGAFPVESDGRQIIGVTWNVTLDLYARYKEYKTSWTNFKAVRSAIFNLLHTYAGQTLGGANNVYRVLLSSSENAQYFRLGANTATPDFIIQTLQVNILQRINTRSI